MAEIGAGGAHRQGRRCWPRNARSSAVAGSAPVAPEITAACAGFEPRRDARTTCRSSARRHRRRACAATDRTRRAVSRASGLAPRACACSRASSTRKAPSEPSAMPPRSRRAPTPARSVLVRQAAERVEQQHVRALGIVGAADQRDVALPGRDARMRDAHRVDAGGFLAHEGARRAGHAVHDRDVAGEQVGELRQEQRRAQVVHQPLVEEGLRLVRACGSPVRIALSTATSRSPPPAATIMSVRASSSALPFTPASSSARPAA